MIDKLLSNIAPYLCYGCGKTGTLLCDNCKYDISSESLLQCILCGKSINSRGVCGVCPAPFTKAWCIGERTDVLRRLIGAYKFERVRAAYEPLTALLDESTPRFPADCTIVPVPTLDSHIRQRGYDHTLLLARGIAKRKNLNVKQLLRRKTRTVQMGSSREVRHQQAQEAFQLVKPIHGGTIILLDDVLTTGATLAACATLLKAGGADAVWVMVLARQPLD